jgi:hypothetical protein
MSRFKRLAIITGTALVGALVFATIDPILASATPAGPDDSVGHHPEQRESTHAELTIYPATCEDGVAQANADEWALGAHILREVKPDGTEVDLDSFVVTRKNRREVKILQGIWQAPGTTTVYRVYYAAPDDSVTEPTPETDEVESYRPTYEECEAARTPITEDLNRVAPVPVG